MKETPEEATSSAFEIRSREVFEHSVESLDMRVISRLNSARHLALDAVGRRPWFFGVRVWTPAAGVAAAALLGIALWLGSPTAEHPAAPTDNAPSLEDLDIVASGDGSGDPMEMLQNDIDFYDFADSAATTRPVANPGPAA